MTNQEYQIEFLNKMNELATKILQKSGLGTTGKISLDEMIIHIEGVYTQGYEEGYKIGCDTGYNIGYNEGYSIGESDGYEAGYAAGRQ